jgi:hypothetical protein
MIEIEELKPHEEVIEEVVAKLAREIREDGIVRDPLMVEQEDHIILDGMHRFSSLERLNCRFAPCCLLDYMSPQITVGSWFRVFTVEKAELTAERILSNMKLDYSLSHMDPTDGYNPDTVILTKGQNGYSLNNSTNILDRCRIAASIEKRLVQDGHPVTYLSEALAIEWLRSERANLVIVLPVFTKDMIRKFGLEGSLLPHKVTRHIIPSRPLAIDVPLSLLTDSQITRQEANDRLGELLADRKIDRRPPGSVIDGRRYDEELLLFSG